MKPVKGGREAVAVSCFYFSFLAWKLIAASISAVLSAPQQLPDARYRRRVAGRPAAFSKTTAYSTLVATRGARRQRGSPAPLTNAKNGVQARPALAHRGECGH